MHFNIGLRFKLIVAFIIHKIVSVQTLAGRVVLALLLRWMIRYKLQLVFGVLCKFRRLLQVKSVNIFRFLNASRRVSVGVLTFPEALALWMIHFVVCRASAFMFWQFSCQATKMLVLLSGAKL